MVSGVPQGSVLGPTLFLIFINDLDAAAEVTGAVVEKFADDTKCFMVTETEEDRTRFQAMLSKLEAWSSNWQMMFNMDKCHVIHAGDKNPKFNYTWGEGSLLATESEKDVGMIVTSNLKPSAQAVNAARKANLVLGQLARGVTYRDRATFIRLYKTFVLPHLCYAAPAWSPYHKGDKEVLERVQKRAVMMVTNLRGSYEERLAALNLRTLEERRIRGDLIECYKVLTGKYNVSLDTWFCLSKEKVGAANTRSSTGYLSLENPPAPRTDMRRNFFSHRVVNTWNTLPDHVKMASTTDQFKNLYDIHTGY